MLRWLPPDWVVRRLRRRPQARGAGWVSQRRRVPIVRMVRRAKRMRRVRRVRRVPKVRRMSRRYLNLARE